MAGYYDLLIQLIFGKTEINAQVEMLRFVFPGNRVLIVGGGTGWILDKIAEIYPEGLEITYVECSGTMMKYARKRNCGANKVSFVQLPVEEFETEERYDCILAGFLFDNFYQEHAAQIVGSLDTFLKDGGYWLFADYYYPRRGGSWWQGLLLRSLYWGARMICRVEANELPDMKAIFSSAGYRVIFNKFYYRGFIQAVVYRKE
ncbi:MAG TPA: class I SAM-dependent methyltransferase [Puia sp.]|nr:class I SAM-dependent methyltransferase [Puia sp.]